MVFGAAFVDPRQLGVILPASVNLGSTTPGTLDAGQRPLPASVVRVGHTNGGPRCPRPQSHSSARGLSLLALGFRPFFLGAGVLALIALPLWLAVLRGWLPGDPYYGGTTWHAHAMLFGYGTAVIAGFLLTASRNWTGIATASGAELAGLAGLWLAGQLAPWLPLPGALIAVLDLAFPLVLALSLVKPLWFGPNPVNRVFLGLLVGMGGASLSGPSPGAGHHPGDGPDRGQAHAGPDPIDPADRVRSRHALLHPLGDPRFRSPGAALGGGLDLRPWRASGS